jgi:dipeptidyl aminopeptidase/acylaminoacyl peptidase
MAEPSIAGMRVEGEKLSPDGSKVIFLWNAEGRMPRDLYLVSTSGGEPTKILSVSDLPAPSRTPEKENKLDYGLVLRDDFVKARENQLGNFEWSPGSRKLLFTYGGDIYVMTLSGADLAQQRNAKWDTLEQAIRRRSALANELVAKYSNASPEFIPWLKTQQKNLDVSMQAGGKWESQRQIVLQIDDWIATGLNRFLHSATPDGFRSDENYIKLINELEGVQNRATIARSDYDRLAQDNKPKRYTKTQSPEVAPRFLDNYRILYQQNGNLFVLNTSDATLTQLSKEANQQNFIGVFGAVPNKEGSLVAYVVSDSSKQRALVVPNYLDEFVQSGNVRRGWSEQKVMVIPTDGSRDSAFEIKMPKPEGVSSFRSIKWAGGGQDLIVDRGDKDTKRRQLFYVHNPGSKAEQVILITEETDDKWQAPLSSIFEPNPKDPSQLFFASERDGYNHLYLAKLQAETRPAVPVNNNARVAESSDTRLLNGKVDITQLTKGAWQVEWGKWLADGNQIFYLSTEEGPSERQLYTIDTTSGNKVRLLQQVKGMIASPQLDEDAQQQTLLYSVSQWNRPEEVYATTVCRGCSTEPSIVKLDSTTPTAFTSIQWKEPKFLSIHSRDGKQIPAKIYLPTGFNAKSKQKYSMVIFVHGAGYLQNVINGWNNYYREFMFNELLTQKGYVVLDIDYRGSAGYGRDWRTDVYDFLGGKDYDDHIDAIDFMVANYNVNQSKIGVYGGSYGGFMAEMLAFRAPDKIAAAAALRPVADWKNYYASSPGYTAQRLGFPDKNPEAYKRSSPITYADGLKTNLLILHGMSDDNVHVQDSVQLIEKLVRLGKTQYFETMLYPSENHGFVRPESWTDEYERILAFFEKHLK